MKKIALFAAFVLAASPALAGPTVHDGFLASTSYGAVRARGMDFNSSTGSELYLGVDGLGTGGYRTDTSFNWASGTHGFTFSYQPGQDRLVATLDFGNNGSTEQTLVYNNFSSNLASLLSYNLATSDLFYMQVSIDERSGDQNIEFQNVMLDSYSLGSFGAPGNSGVLKNWYVDGFDFKSGFTLSGQLSVTLASTNISDERSVMNITFGNAADASGPAVIPAPGAVLLGLIGLGGIGSLRRRFF